MYVPPFNRVEELDEIREMVAATAAAWVVTTGPDGVPLATLLPVLWEGDRVIAHLARANDHWRSIEDGTPVLVICPGPDAYISPTWYAAKAEHGRVVPTWNYTAVHLTGTAVVHHDPAWLLSAVTSLTDAHEGGRAEPWSVSDAPTAYVEGQLRGIVGLEITVTGVEGKAKLSQNRSAADRSGVVAGLRAAGEARSAAVAEAMDGSGRSQ
ncbi:MAG TPA: FMN-binding negative transcriptional regulator [Nocardioides sp.]|nr:FMN-binding negative transcriptional regulator [Nocardioides sp.]